MATLLEDHFVGTNGTNLTAHTMDVGPGWTATAGSIAIQSNAAAASANGDTYTSDAGAADGTLSCTVTLPSPGGSTAGIILRFQNSTNFWYVVGFRVTGLVYLFKVVSGTPSIVASGGSGVAFDVPFLLTVELSGDDFLIKKDGATAITYNDSFLNTATIYGLIIDSGSQAVWDDFSFTTGTPTPPTTITSTIGSAGRDYATPADWIADCPADLVSANQIWRGEMYNDSEFLFTGFGDTMLTISSITTSADCYVELTAAAGESFQDNPSVRATPLRYAQANGVGIRMTGSLSTGILANGYFRCSRLQIYMNGSSGTAVTVGISGSTNQSYQDLLCEFDDASQIGFAQNGGTAINIVAIYHGMDATPAAFVNSGTGTVMVWIGCTAILASDSGGVASSIAFQEASSGGDSTCFSCAAFGFASAMDNTGGGTLNAATTGNATNLGSWGAGSSNQTSVTFSQVTPFVDAALATFDARAIPGTALINNGYLDARAPNDISGTARTATPTIGAWEVVAAAAGNPWFNYAQMRRQ